MKLMRYLSVFKILALITILLPLLPLLLLPGIVHAANLSLNPDSGTVGSTVVVSGNNFIGHHATIYWDGKIVASDITISETGNFNYNLTIPTAGKGKHVISITDDSNWDSSSGSVDFTVLPQIKIFPHIGKEWSPVTITGTGFKSFDEDIKITWDGNVQPGLTIEANSLGSWHTDFTIPNATRGKHSISSFSGTTTAAEIGKIEFIVTPWITVKPLSGPVGTQIIINGWGFRSGEDGITVTWDDVIIQCNTYAEQDGSLMIDGSKRHDGSVRDTVYVPASAQGHHVIGVYGSSFTPKGILPDTDFEVFPHLEVQPASGNAGNQADITGTGFAGNETINISFDETIPLGTVTTNETGSFNTSFVIPQTKGKEHTINAVGNAGNSSQAGFITENMGLVAPQLLSPMQGAEFIIFNSIGDVFIGTAKYLIGVIDYLKGSNPDILRSSPVIFNWSGTTELTAERYIIQIALDDDFSSPVFEREIPNDSRYILSENNALDKGHYSWRIKAVDTMGNESPWSDVSEFEILSMPKRVVILTSVILVLILAAVVLGILTLWVNRSRW